MSQCWYETPTDRPSFSDLKRQVETLLSQNENYLDLSNITDPIILEDSDTFHPSAPQNTLSESKRRTPSDSSSSAAGDHRRPERKATRKDSEELLLSGDSSDGDYEDTPPLITERKDASSSALNRDITSGATATTGDHVIIIPLENRDVADVQTCEGQKQASQV